MIVTYSFNSGVLVLIAAMISGRECFDQLIAWPSDTGILFVEECGEKDT